MTRTVWAIFEGGSLHLLENLPLKNKQKVLVSIKCDDSRVPPPVTARSQEEWVRYYRGLSQLLESDAAEFEQLDRQMAAEIP